MMPLAEHRPVLSKQCNIRRCYFSVNTRIDIALLIAVYVRN